MVDGYSFQDIFNKLQQVIAEELLAEKESITLETPILLAVEFLSPFDARISSGLSRINTDPNVNPLGIDEIDQVELVLAIEKEFGIEMLELEKSASNSTSGYVTLREIIDSILQNLQN
jgi:acyl carrier protein